MKRKVDISSLVMAYSTITKNWESKQNLAVTKSHGKQQVD